MLTNARHAITPVVIQPLALAATPFVGPLVGHAAHGHVESPTSHVAKRDHARPALVLDLAIAAAQCEVAGLDGWSETTDETIDEQLLDVLAIGRTRLGWRGR
jgi:hypothetical protein